MTSDASHISGMLPFIVLKDNKRQRQTTMSSTGLTALMLKGNATLQIWDDDDDDDIIGVDDDDGYEGFAVRIPGSPMTEENFVSEDNPNCGHDAIAKALKALGVVSLDGLKIGGATAPTMGDFVKLFRVDIDAFKKSDSEVASSIGAGAEKENKHPIIQGVYDVLKKGKAFSYFRQFAIDLACTAPNMMSAHGAAIIVLGELYKILTKYAGSTSTAKPPATTTTAATKRTAVPTTAAKTIAAALKPPASSRATEDLIKARGV
jgi:hypothetical protein